MADNQTWQLELGSSIYLLASYTLLKNCVVEGCLSANILAVTFDPVKDTEVVVSRKQTKTETDQRQSKTYCVRTHSR